MEFARQVRRPAPVRQAAQQERDGKMTFAPAIVHRVLNEPGRPLGAEAPGAVASVLANFTLAPPGMSSASRIGAHGSSGESGRLFFSGVRIHTDTGAAASARAVAATAYTAGNHIVFGENRYRPGTDAGSRLIAHELTHVLQQRHDGPAVLARQVSGVAHDPSDPANYATLEEYKQSAPGPWTNEALEQRWYAAHPMKIIDGKGPNTPWREELKFAVRHPLIADDIGSVKLGSGYNTNISTVAARLAIHSGLSEPKAFGNMGTEVNALRHATWQSTITARYGADIAEKVGYAHEENPSVNKGITNFSNVRFKTLAAADQSVDLKNNEIGREIGGKNPKLTPKGLAIKSLEQFHDQGLWMAQAQPDGTYAIAKTLITDAAYKKARAALELLDENGFTAADLAAIRAKQDAFERMTAKPAP